VRAVTVVLALGTALAGGCATPPAKRAEWQLSFYLGKTHNVPTDIKLFAPTTNLRFHDVPLQDLSFDWSPQPAHYGARVWRWDDRNASDGWMFDYQHAKARVETTESRRVSGVFEGTPVSGVVPVNSIFQRWRLSFGHNLCTINRLHRWFPKGKRDKSAWGRMQLYAGAGAGVAVPNPLVQIRGERTTGYRPSGWVAQGLAGVNYDVWGPFSVFGEFKMVYADIDVDLVGGGTTSANIWTGTLLFGGSVRL
jgi:hypothetical protein